MLISKIGYFKVNNVALLSDNANKIQQSRNNTLTEGFGNYDKNNFYSVDKVNFFTFMKNSLSSIFSKNKQNSKNIAIIV